MASVDPDKDAAAAPGLEPQDLNQPAPGVEPPAGKKLEDADSNDMAAGLDDDAAGGPKQDAEGAGDLVEKAAETAASLPGMDTASNVVNNITNNTTINQGGPEKKKPTLGERFLGGESGAEFGKDLGNKAAETIKNLFGKGDKKPGGQSNATSEVSQEGTGGNTKQKQKAEGQEQGQGGLNVGGGLGKTVGGMIGSAIGGEKAKSVGQALGKAVGNIGGQVANMAVDHAKGIGGSIGGAVGGLVGGEEGKSVGKGIGKGVGSAVTSVRDALAGQGVTLGPKQAAGKVGPKL